MAEGWLRYFMSNNNIVKSAGLKPKGVHPLAIKVMNEAGVDISGHTSDSVNKFINDKFDFIITVCDNAAENCPVFSGGGKKIHMPFDDPDAATGTDEEILETFRRVRDEIKIEMKNWLESL
ncbi:MAG: arsenate reductase ArsC [candidate division Zixibacteria bacterium]|nr:arsenate reductase ArsC [candidate division Zixibacteria bacterium]